MALALPLLGLLLSLGFTVSHARAQAAVSIKEDALAYTLDNGIVAARIDKSSGDLVSLNYKGAQMLATILGADGLPDMSADPAGANGRGFGPFTDHQYGFWSHDAMGPRDTAAATAKITIDPKSNAGERGEVSIKGISGGRKMGTGPGSSAQGNFISDIEIRWSMGRADSGVYTYCVFEHKPEYPASTITEARFCVKLNDTFDWLSIADDPHHFKHYPRELREGDKYIYTTDQFDNPAFGWSSTTSHVGFYLINPSMEYMSGGPTKIEFLGHRDTNQVAAPCVLNYWRSSHYGGAEAAVADGEHWTKVIGPFMLYVNSGSDPQSIYQDAREQAVKESRKWPFDWVSGIDYPRSTERATVKGQLVLSDPLMPDAKMSHVRVGLTAPAYTSAAAGFGGAKRTVDWQQDAKHYEFWIRGSDDGQFEIPNVRPGTYTLHAFADGVLGEFARTDVAVEAGKPLDLGKLQWTPVRRGRQLWDVGIPNRNGSEFFKGDVYWTPKIGQTYPALFPNDVNYTIGKSDFAKDWFFQQVPRFDEALSAATAAAAPARGRRGGATTGPAFARGAGPATLPSGRAARGPAGYGDTFGPAAMGRATPYSIIFDLPAAPRGKATLRLALSGTGARTLDIAVDDKSAGTLNLPPGDGVISDHGIQGIWREIEFPFDASLMKQGQNTLRLTVPQGNLTAGIIYDYLRLELDESAQVSAPAAG
jgi:rhamnogalacturonan endolyase